MRFKTVLVCFLTTFLLIAWSTSAKAEPGSLDGVKIEAWETYKNPKNHLFGIGTAIYPFDPYHYSFCVTAYYTYYFTRFLGWEILHGTYAFNVRKGLLEELAEEFNKTPEERTQKLRFMVSSNLTLTLFYGKNIFFESFIRHYRGMFFIGPGILNSSKHDIAVTGNFGFRFEMFITDWASLTLDIRDTLAITKEVENFLGFHLGFAVSL